MLSRKQLSTRKNGYQSLEGRRLLAGNVTVFENFHLYIRGDQADNQFEVVVENDKLKINGLDGTTINGQDSILVETAMNSESGLSFEGGLRAHLGPGHDSFLIRDAQFESMSLIYGGTGNDSVEIDGTNFLDKATVQTFDGQDSVSTIDSQFADTFRILTLDGRDSVSMIDTVFDGDSIVVTGEHADTIHSENNHYLGEVNLLLPLNGDDTVQLTNPVVGENQLGVFLGNGDDSIGSNLVDAAVDGSIVISGQAGADETLGMAMSDEVAESTSIRSIEKDELVFESGLGGTENVTSAASTYEVTLDEDTEFEPYTYIEQYAAAITLEETTTITQIDWSGSYNRDFLANFHGAEELPDLGDSFIIEILEDAGDGAPDPRTAVRFEVGEANRSEEVGSWVAAVFEYEIPLYAYHAEIEYTMEAGKQYWVSIFTEVDSQEYEFRNMWEWGFGIKDDSFTTAVNQAYDKTLPEHEWRFYPNNPYILQGFEMDFRLRSGV